MGGCAAPNCKNRTQTGYRTFKVPADPKRAQQWLANSKCKSFSPHSNICEVHFDKTQFERRREDGWKKLKPNAVPTIFHSATKYTIKSEMKKVSSSELETNPKAFGQESVVSSDSSTVLPVSVELEKNPEQYEAEDSKFLAVKTGRRRCCICYKTVLLPKCVPVFRDSDRDTCSDFGRIMCAILRESESTLLTRYACMRCSGQVVQCFELLMSINAAAVLTSRRFEKKSEAAALDEGCHLCGDVLPTVEEFTNHFTQHMLNGDLEKINRKRAKKNDYTLGRFPLDCEQEVDGNGKNVELRNRMECVSQEKMDDPILRFKNDGSELVKEEHSYNKMKRTRADECSRICHLCGRTFKSRFTMARHMTRHHADPDFPSKRKEGKGVQRQRKINNTDTVPLLCTSCEILFNDKTSLMDHKVLMHGENLEELLGNRDTRREWTCTICCEKFSTRSKLGQHSRKEHAGSFENQCQCQLCKKWLPNKVQLRRHLEVQHIEHHPFRCSLCEECFASQKTLEKHVVNSHCFYLGVLSAGERSEAEVEERKKEDLEAMMAVRSLEAGVLNNPDQEESIANELFAPKVDSIPLSYNCL